MLMVEKNFGWAEYLFPATRKSLEGELSSEGALQLTIPNGKAFYVGRPDIINKEYNAENRLILASGATPMTVADAIIRECSTMMGERADEEKFSEKDLLVWAKEDFELYQMQQMMEAM